MSGVTGAERIRSRKDFEQFLKSYHKILSKFPNFVSMQPSGSYNSDLSKEDFGDIDIIVHINSTADKPLTKKKLQAFLLLLPETIVVPFTSDKHAGKRSYNAGELISVRYHDKTLGYSVQIDNIVALTHDEAEFKHQFLNMAAEKQGLVLGLIKIAAIESNIGDLFEKLDITEPAVLPIDNEYEFNLSSVELQLRKVVYVPGTYQQASREIVWNSTNFDNVAAVLSQYNLDVEFKELLDQCNQQIQNPRSKNRIQGVFSSMITVKSGEVGTAKGAAKEAALTTIQETLNDAKVVFAFGRFQPPTIGHQLLINKVKDTAAEQGAAHVIYVSKTQDHKTNPLSVDTKIKYLKQMFPDTNFVACDSIVRTPIEAARSLNVRYNNLIMVAGADRVPLFKKLLTDYNGKEYQYRDIQLASSGNRDPNSKSIDGISGTKMRDAARNNNFTLFRKGISKNINSTDAKLLLLEIQRGLVKQ